MRINFVAAGAVVSLLCLLGEHATAQSQIKAAADLLKLAQGTSFGRALGPSLKTALKSKACRLIIYRQTESTAKLDFRELLRATGLPDVVQVGPLVNPASGLRQRSPDRISVLDPRPLEPLSEEQQQALGAAMREGLLRLRETRSLRSLRNPPHQLGDEVELLEMYERMLKEHRGADFTVELCVKSNGELSLTVSYHELTMSFFATRGKVTLSAISPDGTKTATVSSSLDR